MTTTKAKSVRFNCSDCKARVRGAAGDTTCTACKIKRDLRAEIHREEAHAKVQETITAVAERRSKAAADRRYDVVDAFGLDIYDGNAVVRLLNTDGPREARVHNLERALYYIQRQLSKLRAPHTYSTVESPDRG